MCMKMNEIVNKFLLVGDRLMPEMHLKQPGFTFSACGPFTKNKKNWEVYADWQNKRFSEKNSDKNLKDKAFKIASDPKYDG